MHLKMFSTEGGGIRDTQYCNTASQFCQLPWLGKKKTRIRKDLCFSVPTAEQLITQFLEKSGYIAPWVCTMLLVVGKVYFGFGSLLPCSLRCIPL